MGCLLFQEGTPIPPGCMNFKISEKGLSVLPVTCLGLDIVGTSQLDYRRTMTLSSPVPDENRRCLVREGSVSDAWIGPAAVIPLLYHCQSLLHRTLCKKSSWRVAAGYRVTLPTMLFNYILLTWHFHYYTLKHSRYAIYNWAASHMEMEQILSRERNFEGIPSLCGWIKCSSSL